MAVYTKHVYVYGGVDLAFFLWKLPSSLLIKDHFMVFVFWILQMFVPALFTHPLVAGIAVKLTVLFTVLFVTD
jgi:hypothetical protein